MIPKVIHYCWFGGAELPETAKRCMESWKRYCPNYQIVRWDESNFDINLNNYVHAAYSAKKWAFVSDVARLKILYEHGGIYFDTDVEVLKSFDTLLNNHAFMGTESTGSINSGLGCGAEAKHPIIGELLADYDNAQFDPERPICCPVMTTQLLVKKGYKFSSSIQTIDGLTIYPTEFFAPIDSTTRKLAVTKNTFSIHHYDASWHSEEKKTHADSFYMLQSARKDTWIEGSWSL